MGAPTIGKPIPIGYIDCRPGATGWGLEPHFDLRVSATATSSSSPSREWPLATSRITTRPSRSRPFTTSMIFLRSSWIWVSVSSVSYSIASLSRLAAPVDMLARNFCIISGEACWRARAIVSVLSSRTTTCISRSGNPTASSNITMDLRTFSKIVGRSF